MNILVTGGAGYVGSILAASLLARGHRVRVLDSLVHGGQSLLGVWCHPEFELVKGDVRESGTVKEALKGMEAVVHLAAVVGDPACARCPEKARSINLDASLQLKELCVDLGVRRYIFASTCSNYGKMAALDSSLDETSPLKPVSLYAETKVAVEQALIKTSQVDFYPTCLRFATAFGVSPRMRFDLTVNHFTMEMLVKRHLVIFGEQFWRPYVHIRDIAKAVLLVLESDEIKVGYQVYNVGSNTENYRKQDIVGMIYSLAPEAEVEYVHKDEDPRDYKVSFDKISRDLGYEACRLVPDGIREVAALVNSGIIQDFDDPAYHN
jgi:nucleoside-diphosphate-sugar epimerase